MVPVIKHMMPPARATIRLTRWQAYYGAILSITAAGLVRSNSSGLLPALIILLANLTSYAFAFMFNDIEDAQDDAHDPNKRKRNPVSDESISQTLAYLATAAVGGISLLLFYALGTLPFLFGLGSIVIGFLYSWKGVRLKSLPVVDLVSHGLLGTCNFLAAATISGNTTHVGETLFISVLLFTLSAVSDLNNELRDFVVDRKAKLTNTVHYINLFPLKRFMILLVPLLLSIILIDVLLHMSYGAALVLVIICLGVALHYYVTWFRNKGHIYDYPHTQKFFLVVSIILIIDSLYK